MTAFLWEQICTQSTLAKENTIKKKKKRKILTCVKNNNKKKKKEIYIVC